MNSLWLVVPALAAFAVAYRFYSAFLAARVAVLDDRNPTPAHRLNDGVDYHPTKRIVLFGHHFAAIAGPGPLIGPVLASQWGYFPGFAWIVIGACLAGGVHDFVILVASVRQDGLTLSKIARDMIGPVSGTAAAVATLFIVVSVLASVAMVVVMALSHSAWGMFTIVVTIPAALLTGFWMYKIRPGRVAEASVIGVAMVLAGVFFGKPFADSSWGHFLLFDNTALKIMLPVYAAIASILPVWVLMCPRDYLSSYMKIGVIVVLAVGIFVAQPDLKMPATTPFLGGGGPVVSGAVWPFVSIVIMCGALSGFHALIASGTTPKMINKESDIRPIGYGAMILEGFVALTALVAACALEPGDYFRINTPQASDLEKTHYVAMVETERTAHQWDLTPKELPALEQGVRETLVGRTGGAVTLAVGMAKVFANLPGMKHLMAYWYHFVIMFEALFILTLLETGTRVARFVFEETLSSSSSDRSIRRRDWALNATTTGVLIAVWYYLFRTGDGVKMGQVLGDLFWYCSGIRTYAHLWVILLLGASIYLLTFASKRVRMSVGVCALWGGLLYLGNLETLWRMLGIANQLLATIALAVGTTYLLQHAPKRVYALCTAVPFLFAVTTVFTAGVQSIHTWWNKADLPAADLFLMKLACVLASIMLVLSAVIVIDALRRWYVLLNGARLETPELGGESAQV